MPNGGGDTHGAPPVRSAGGACAVESAAAPGTATVPQWRRRHDEGARDLGGMNSIMGFRAPEHVLPTPVGAGTAEGRQGLRQQSVALHYP